MGYKNIWYRPNPINLKKFQIINKVKNKTKTKILLNVGQFMPRKNQKFLVQIMKFIPKNFRLILCGPLATKGSKKDRDLEYFKEIKSYIAKNKLNKKITLVPKYVNILKYLKKTNIYLMPSYNEGLGNTILESLASGIPVIANSSEPSFKEIIRNNKNGYLLKMKPEIWAKNIVKNANILDSKKVRKNSKEIFKQSDQNKVDSDYFKIFKKLIQK